MTKKYNSGSKSVTYSNLDRRVWKDQDLVYKTDPSRLDTDWRRKMELILKHWDIPAFEGFIEGGYKTRYVDGTDIHGNRPFEMDPSNQSSVLCDDRALEVLDVFAEATKVGKKLGYTLGDITCGNILIGRENLHMIDYEVITDYPLNSDYVNIWRNTLRIVFGAQC